MSRVCAKCEMLIYDEDLYCMTCAADRRQKEKRREIDFRLLEKKQQERREFVKSHFSAITQGWHACSDPRCSMKWPVADRVKMALDEWEELDKQLTAREEKEKE